MDYEFGETEKRTGYVFRDKELLKRALTLSSFDGEKNNQSLECLGDAILGFVVAEKYYLAGMDEGCITQMKKSVVSDAALTVVSERLGLDRALLRGKGDDNNKKAVPSAYEALTAAVYLDGGMEKAREFALSTLDFTVKAETFDYISALQELVQAAGHPAPVYEKEDCGTPQKPQFTATVRVDGKVYVGKGGSFALAKKRAAKAAYGACKKGK